MLTVTNLYCKFMDTFLLISFSCSSIIFSFRLSISFFRALSNSFCSEIFGNGLLNFFKSVVYKANKLERLTISNIATQVNLISVCKPRSIVLSWLGSIITSKESD